MRIGRRGIAGPNRSVRRNDRGIPDGGVNSATVGELVVRVGASAGIADAGGRPAAAQCCGERDRQCADYGSTVNVQESPAVTEPAVS